MTPSKCFLVALVFLAACAALGPAPLRAQSPATPASLAAYRNNKRVLLVFAPSAGDGRYLMQKQAFVRNAGGTRERDLVLVPVLGSESRLHARFGVPANAFRVLLIGKDGNAAYSSARPVSLPDLFRRIDAMPMRRDEMHRHKK